MGLDCYNLALSSETFAPDADSSSPAALSESASFFGLDFFFAAFFGFFVSLAPLSPESASLSSEDLDSLLFSAQRPELWTTRSCGG